MRGKRQPENSVPVGQQEGGGGQEKPAFRQNPGERESKAWSF